MSPRIIAIALILSASLAVNTLAHLMQDSPTTEASAVRTDLYMGPNISADADTIIGSSYGEHASLTD